MPVVLEVVLAISCLMAAIRWSDAGRAWDDRHRLAMAAGALSFLLFMGLVLLSQMMIEMGAVALITAMALVLMWSKVSRRERTVKPGPPEIDR